MRECFLLLLLIPLLAGCNTPGFMQSPEPTLTGLPNNTQCAWNWATQALPELGARLEADMQAAGLNEMTVRAEAYGENCINAAGTVDSFAAMETDFRITMQVNSFSDTSEIGRLLERILAVLDGYPTGSTPGTNPGYVGVSFQKGGEALNLWFTVTAGKSARALGYRGAALFEELQKK